MSNQISSQASKFWSMLTSPDTSATYQKTIDVTWSILREGGILIWLVLCLVLVFFDWLGSTAIGLGRDLRASITNLQETNTDQLASNTGKAVLDLGKSSINNVIAAARKQLGLPERPAPSPAPVSSAPVSSVPVSSAPPVVAPTTKLEAPISPTFPAEDD